MLQQHPSDIHSSYQTVLMRLQETLIKWTPQSPDGGVIKDVLMHLLRESCEQERQRICRILNEV